jgi:predicted RNase H-like HicB family nuclease
MDFDVLITQEADSTWQAVTAALPNCTVTGATREEAIAQITACLTESYSHAEVLRLSIPTNGAASNGASPVNAAPKPEWPGYGIFKDDPTLDELFDEIERRRDEHMVGG